MSYEVITKSHQEVDAGFYANFGVWMRLGMYAFVTDHFAAVIQALARGETSAQLLTFPKEKFWEAYADNSKQLHQVISQGGTVEEIQRAFAQLETANLDVKVEQQLYTQGNVLRVQQGPNSILVPPYEMDFTHFGRFSWYVARGGLFGCPEPRPAYIQPTIDAILASRNPIFEEVQQEHAKYMARQN